MTSPRTLVAFLGAASILGTAGCGATAQGRAAPYPRGAVSPVPSGAATAAPGGTAAAATPQLGALASRLGVSRARLRAAFASIAPPAGPSGSPADNGPATALAKALGLPTAKVKAALGAVVPCGGLPAANGARAPPPVAA